MVGIGRDLCSGLAVERKHLGARRLGLRNEKSFLALLVVEVTANCLLLDPKYQTLQDTVLDRKLPLNAKISVPDVWACALRKRQIEAVNAGLRYAEHGPGLTANSRVSDVRACAVRAESPLWWVHARTVAERKELDAGRLGLYIQYGGSVMGRTAR